MMARAAERPKVVTVAEAAFQLSLDPRQVYGLIYAGHLTPVRLPSRNGNGGGPVRIEQAEIDQFIASHRHPATSPA
jgi:hypothetical protein